jgi:hypothetical protein
MRKLNALPPCSCALLIDLATTETTPVNPSLSSCLALYHHLPAHLAFHHPRKHPHQPSHHPDPVPFSPFRSPIALLSYHPNPTHDSNAPRRGWTAECHPAAVRSRRWRAFLAVSFLLSCRLLIDQAASGRRSFPDGAPAVGRRCSGRECQGACHAVRGRSMSTIRFRVEGPAVQPSGVRPSGVRPAWCPPVRPVTSVWSALPGGGLKSTSVRRGSLHDGNGSSSTWSAVSRLTARSGLDVGDAAEVVGKPAGERRSRIGPGRARAQAAAALDPDRPGQASPA